LLGLESYAASSIFCDPEYILNVRPVTRGDKKAVQLQFSRREDKTVLLTSPDFNGRGRTAKAKRLRSTTYLHLSNTDFYEVREDSDGWRVVFDKTLGDSTATDSPPESPDLVSPALNSEALAERWLSDVLEIVRASDQDKENFHLLEHILLRPNEDLKETLKNEKKANGFPFPEDLEDYYSFIVSVMLPGWTERFKDPNYRRFVEQIFRREAPAHLYLRFCWLDKNPMRKFEELYKNWREAILDCAPDEECTTKAKAEELITWLNGLDCKPSTENGAAYADPCKADQEAITGDKLA